MIDVETFPYELFALRTKNTYISVLLKPKFTVMVIQKKVRFEKAILSLVPFKWLK